MKKIVLLFVVLTGFTHCQKNLPAPFEPLVCTENFVQYSIEIPGETLEDFFTLRAATQDTIRLEPIFTDINFYPVLNDLYKDSLVETQERFLFVGRQGEERFEVPFVFTSDRCHILKISGPEFYNPRGE